jgi:hypothetical protein
MATTAEQFENPRKTKSFFRRKEEKNRDRADRRGRRRHARQRAGLSNRILTTDWDSLTPAVHALKYFMSAGVDKKMRYLSFTHQAP